MADIECLLHRRADLSTFLVHFTRESVGTSARDNLLSILQSRTIEARRAMGMAAKRVEAQPLSFATQKVVCFTETPLEHAWMMVEDIDNRDVAFSQYGIVVTKTYARRRACNPVWYLDITPGHDWLTNPINQLVNDAIAQATSGVGGGVSARG